MHVQVFSVRVDAPHLVPDQEQLNSFIASVDLIHSDTHFIESDASYWSVMLHYREKINFGPAEKEALEDLTDSQKERYAQLKQWRNDKAKTLAIKPFIVCHNQHLLQIAVQFPKALVDFQWIKGFGTKRTENYATELLQLLENSGSY